LSFGGAQLPTAGLSYRIDGWLLASGFGVAQPSVGGWWVMATGFGEAQPSVGGWWVMATGFGEAQPSVGGWWVMATGFGEAQPSAEHHASTRSPSGLSVSRNPHRVSALGGWWVMASGFGEAQPSVDRKRIVAPPHRSTSGLSVSRNPRRMSLIDNIDNSEIRKSSYPFQVFFLTNSRRERALIAVSLT
jgi:hypothetical protein